MGVLERSGEATGSLGPGKAAAMGREAVIEFGLMVGEPGHSDTRSRGCVMED
jgi:hypothetical protein